MYEQIKIFFVNVEIFFRTQILYSTDDGGPAAGAVAKQRGGGERHGLGLAVARAGPHRGAARTPAHLRLPYGEGLEGARGVHVARARGLNDRQPPRRVQGLPLLLSNS